MTRRDRLRRVTLLCSSFGRNLAYYRVGQEDDAQRLLSEAHPHASFWRQANSNFLDVCVLEWCKLFADRRDQHYWGHVISDSAGFEAGLFGHLCMARAALTDLIKTMRRYRDKFVAHLDADFVMHIPRLDAAQIAVWYYHSYLVDHEAKAGELVGLARSHDSMTLGYQQCVDEARAIILHAR